MVMAIEEEDLQTEEAEIAETGEVVGIEETEEVVEIEEEEAEEDNSKFSELKYLSKRLKHR
jgi:Mg/Co/Ni transporter MgtE